MIVARVVSLLKFCGFLHFSTEQYDVMTNVLFFSKFFADGYRASVSADIVGRQNNSRH